MRKERRTLLVLKNGKLVPPENDAFDDVRTEAELRRILKHYAAQGIAMGTVVAVQYELWEVPETADYQAALLAAEGTLRTLLEPPLPRVEACRLETTVRDALARIERAKARRVSARRVPRTNELTDRQLIRAIRR